MIAFVKCVRYETAIRERENEKGEIVEEEDKYIVQEEELPLRTSQFELRPFTNMFRLLTGMKHEHEDRWEGLTLEQSGWVILGVTSLIIEIAKCRPLVGSCREGEELKELHIKNRRFLRNVDIGKKDSCFFTAVAQHFVKHERNKKKMKLKTKRFIQKNMNVKEFKLPFHIRDIPKFEKANSHLNIKINVVYRESDIVIPLHSERVTDKTKKVINLLLVHFLLEDKKNPISELFSEEPKEQISDMTEGCLKSKVKSHFFYITSLSKFLRTSYDDVTERRNHSHELFCHNCLTKFYNANLLKEHEDLCYQHKVSKTITPQEGATLKFKNFNKTVKANFVGFADFESSHIRQTPTPTSENSKTKILAEQKPVSFCIIFVDKYNKVVYKKTQYNDNPDELISLFFKALNQAHTKLEELSEQHNVFMETPEMRKLKEQATHCGLCNIPFTADDKVFDHCHYTGKLLHIAHANCNLQRNKFSETTAIFMHNFSGYDSHLLIRHINKENAGSEIHALPYNSEKIRCLQWRKFVFKDSMQFLNSSLSTLVDDLRASGSDFKLLNKSGLCKNRTEKELLLRKGVFPYEMVTSCTRLSEIKSFPPKKCFFSTLSQSTISEEDYKHGLNVFSAFNCSSLLDYLLLYNKLDVYLLAIVMLQFREDFFEEFGLDICHYVSFPSATYDGMLKQTNVTIERLSDINMILWIESALRGGVSTVSERHMKSDEKTKAIFCDANNLYGLSQSLPQPIGEYVWIENQDELNKIDILGLTDDDEYSYIFEVDLAYDKSLHDEHNSLPLAPFKQTITSDMLSPQAFKLKSQISGVQAAKNYKSKKLVATLDDREHYITHAQNLKTYLQLGLKVKHIHKALRFKQSFFLRDFVSSLTKKRAMAKTNFKRTLYKLAVNSTFGKFIEQVRNYLQCKFITSPASIEKWVSNPRFKNYKIISEDLVIVFLSPLTVSLDKCYLIGFSILERSKEFMFSMYYTILSKLLGGHESCSVCLTDTDSFLIKVQAQQSVSYSHLINRILPALDTSNYPSDHKFFSTNNKAKLGYFKDELCGLWEIDEYVGLRSKCYTLKTNEIDAQPLPPETRNLSSQLSNAITTKCKGITKSVSARLPFSSFYNCLRDDTTRQATIHR